MNQNEFALSLPPDGYSPIFVGGLQRSGTKLMRLLLDSHPHIACGQESKLFRDNRLERIYTDLRTIWPPGLDPRYGFAPHTLDQVMAGLIHQAVLLPYCQQQGKPRWANKTPETILFIDTLFALFPAAQFIHMIRDPRDAFCSIRERAAKSKKNKPRWPKLEAAEWCGRINCGLAWRERPDRYREVHYENLVTQPEATLRTLLAFLDEPWAASMLENNPIFSTSVGRWRTQLSAAEVAEMEAVAGPTMLALGYPLSTASLSRAMPTPP